MIEDLEFKDFLIFVIAIVCLFVTIIFVNNYISGGVTIESVTFEDGVMTQDDKEQVYIAIHNDYDITFSPKVELISNINTNCFVRETQWRYDILEPIPPKTTRVYNLTLYTLGVNQCAFGSEWIEFQIFDVNDYEILDSVDKIKLRVEYKQEPIPDIICNNSDVGVGVFLDDSVFNVNESGCD